MPNRKRNPLRALPDEVLQLLDRSQVKDVVIRFSTAMDLQDWEMLRACLADEIEVDYSDLRGEPPQFVTADDFVEQRKSGLAGLKTQHLSFNHQIRIDNDGAICASTSLILRFAPQLKKRNFFNTHCRYEHSLIRTTKGWRILKIRQHVLWNEGHAAVHGFHRQRQQKSKR